MNGDLTLSGPGGYGIVTGFQKLIQDLKHWILEARGTDPLHPDYGSTIDGGVLPDGTVSLTNIGQLVDKNRLMSIENETTRVLFAYQEQQLARLTREKTLYGNKSTFSTNELLYSINSVVAQQIGDVVVVNVSITTESGATLQFAQAAG